MYKIELINRLKFLIKHMNVLCMVSMLFAIAGCGIVPTWVSMTHSIGDVILAHKTGKSSGEHGLSAITGKDCQLIRLIDFKDICMSSEEYESYLLSLNCDIYTWNIFGRVSCKKI